MEPEARNLEPLVRGQRGLAIELDAQVSDAHDFARLAADWLTQVREELFPNLDQGLKAGPVLFPRRRDDEFYQVRGEPGAVWAELWVRRKPALLGGSTTLFSQRAWDRLLSGLQAAYPFHIHIAIAPLDGDGQKPWAADASIAIDRSHEQPEWVNFMAACSQAAVPGIARADVRRRWADFAYEWATRLHASYGVVSAGGGGPFEGAVEVSSRRSGHDPPVCSAATPGLRCARGTWRAGPAESKRCGHPGRSSALRSCRADRHGCRLPMIPISSTRAHPDGCSRRSDSSCFRTRLTSVTCGRDCASSVTWLLLPVMVDPPVPRLWRTWSTT